MSKISIKKDFKNGDTLYDVDLNNNFSVIEAGVNANEENLDNVIKDAELRLQKELEDITADRGWDWNGGNRVTFFKGSATEVEAQPIKDGQLLYNTETGETALDDNGERINTGSGNVVVVSDTQPTNEATKDWIKPIIINGTETAEEYFKNSKNQWKKILNQPSGDTLPIGSIAQFGGATAPTNWLICNGQAVSRETYSELFAVIGTTYGEGNGSTTFNLPDFSSRSPMGLGTGTDGTNSENTILGQEKGEYKHQLTVAEIPPLDVYAPKNTSGGNIAYLSNYNGYQGSGLSTTPLGKTKLTENEAHNTIHPVLGVNFIIKAKQSIGVLADVTRDINDTNDGAVPNANTVKGYVDTSINNLKSDKVLWSGDEAPAGKTYTLTDNIFNYRAVCVVGSWGNKFYIPIIKNNNYLFGGMNYMNGSNQMVTTGLNASITDNGNKVNVTYFKQLTHLASSNHGTYSEPNLLQIIGIK